MVRVGSAFLLLVVDSFEREEYLVFSGLTVQAVRLDQEECIKLFGIPGEVGGGAVPPAEMTTLMQAGFQEEQQGILGEITERNRTYFESEMEKLENWAEDLKNGLERELKELDKEIKTAKKEARQTMDLDAKLAFHKKAKDIERRRTEKRRSLFDAQDEVDNRKEALLADVEARLRQRIEVSPVFTIRWRVV